MTVADFSQGYPCPICGTLFPTWDEMDEHAAQEADKITGGVMMNIDAIRRVNAINRGEVKPSKDEQEAIDAIDRIFDKAEKKP